MEKMETGVRALVRVLGLPPPFPQHTGVWFTSPSLAMHLGPNGERCRDKLGQHGCGERLHPGKRQIRSLTYPHAEPKRGPTPAT